MSASCFYQTSFTILMVVFISLFFPSLSLALGDTDTVTWGGDNSRAGYQTNHNLDPKVVASTDFSQIFGTKLPGNFNGLAPEQIYSQPLVYTGKDGIQYVYVATTQNNIYKLDAKTGAIVASRNLHVPFLQVELESCTDINPLIGITATGVIDPDTGIWYLTAKTYTEQFQDGQFSPKNPPGRLNGRYWQHAIHTEDLSEAANWPVLVDGTVFRNNPNRMFIGGNQHSRPGALLVGDYVYTGYASHCVQYNVTGAIIGFHKSTGKIVEAFATEGGPEPNTVRGGGIWMSGGGLTYDGKGSMYFTTGNGYASQLKPTGNSVPGRSPPTSLEEAAVNAKINADGTLSIIDFFMPWEKVQLDGADKDLGATPLAILPSDVYSCANHRRIGVVTAKSGKTYWLNLDDLGGYQNGPNAQDAVIQVFQNENSVYAGAGVLPLGGGYVYISVTQFPTHVFKFSCSAAGNAIFTKVADTPDKNAYTLGTGHGTTTSLRGQEGTGLLWTTDVEGQNLRIYDPIPPAGGGSLTLLKAFSIPRVTKFSRPVFGNGRVYVGTTEGYIYGFGSPVNVPFNCSSPYDFGLVPIGNVSDSVTITCTALVDTTVQNIIMPNNSNFRVSNLPGIPFDITSGKTFSLTAVSNPQTVGSLSSDVLVQTRNKQAGYSSSTSITLQVTSHSSEPLLAVAPNTISFSVIAGQASEPQTALFRNLGDTLLTFQNISFSLVSERGPWVAANTTADGNLQVEHFVFADRPSTIQNGSSALISVIYSPDAPGNHTVYMTAFSDGGDVVVDVFGVAGTPSKAVIEFQTVDASGWVPYTAGTSFNFGTVYQSQTRTLLMRITNGGGLNAVPLSITVSKPPYGIPGIIGKANNIDLAEGVSLKAGESQTAALYCSVPKSQVNVPSYTGNTTWVLNTGDPNQGKQEIQFLCTAAAEQVGPLMSNGTAQYEYVGCFKENNPGRQLATNPYSDINNNTNGRCINACKLGNYTFAGTQYMQECWCGNAIPIQKHTDRDCNFGCSGDKNQICGGDGYLHDEAHISLFADSSKFDGNTTSPPLQITPSVGRYNFIGCYQESGGKTLTQTSTASNGMTVQVCAAFCEDYAYFGLEFSSECYCDTKLNSQSKLVDNAQCNMPCKGSNSQYCGAGSRMQIYQADGTPSSSTSIVSSPPISPSSSKTSGFSSAMSPIISSSVSTTTPSTRSSISSTSSTLSPTAPSSTSTGLPAPIASIGAYISVGCYTDNPIHVLIGKSFSNASMTISLCHSFCQNSTFFGLENGNECYCGNGLPLSSSPATDSRCKTPCPANSSQLCGGTLGLSIYQLAPPTTGNPQRVGEYLALGCFAEKLNGRVFEAVFYSDDMTIELCAEQAKMNRWKYFGTEYGRECWMGNDSSKATAADQIHCSLRCVGNSFETCGGGNYLQLYGMGEVNTTERAEERSVGTHSAFPVRIISTADPFSTVSVPSTEIETSRVFLFSSSTSSSLSLTASSTSTIASPRSVSTNPTTAFFPTTSMLSSSTATSSSSTISSSSSPSISIPSLPTINSYIYTGCFLDPAPINSSPRLPRALSALPVLRNSTHMTPSLCAIYCFQYAYFGLEYSDECWCGAYPSPNSTLVPHQNECNMPCSGDLESICGGAARLSLYHSNDTTKVSTDPGAPGPVVGNYTYAACYVDTGAPRLLPVLFTSENDGMTTSTCIAAAESAGYTYAGLEFGQECWMGNALSIADTGNIQALDEEECKSTCVGARGEQCGGPNRMSVWVRR